MLGDYGITVLILAGINMVAVLGLNIVTGFAGQVSLGHAAFMGLGAYTSALFARDAGIGFWVSLPVAILVSAIIGAVIGSISLRVREDFLAVATIGINFVVVSVFHYVRYFGGAMGIGHIPRPELLGVRLEGPYFLALVVVAVLIAVALNVWLTRSWVGIAFQALRDDETASRAIGIDVRRFKVFAFALATGVAGMAGSLYAHFMTYISPYDFGFPLSVAFLSMLVLGGPGTIRGPIFGALLLTSAPEVFRFLDDYRMLLYGGLLLVLMRYEPGGLLGNESRLWRLLKAVLGVKGQGAAARNP